MGKHFGGKTIKTIKTEVRENKLWRVIVFADGTTDEKPVKEEAISKLLDTIKHTPEIELVHGGKRQRSAGMITAEGLGLIFLGLLLLGLMSVLSGCLPAEDERCVGPNWHRYDDCY